MKERGRRKTITGVVTSDRMDKTIVVRATRLVRHPKYEKTIRCETVCKAHDEKNEARVGDLVEIMETRPLSKTKHWRLVRIIRRAGAPVEAEVIPEEEEP